MRALKYVVHNPLREHDWMIYVVFEDDDGKLRWYYIRTCYEPAESVPIDRAGRMTQDVVSDTEAELLTGLFAPAAYDRLREMLHESEVTCSLTMGWLRLEGEEP